MLHTPSGHFYVTHVLSNRDSTSLTVEDTAMPGLIRVRIENADVEVAVLLDRSEAEWLRDRLIDGVGLMRPTDGNGN